MKQFFEGQPSKFVLDEISDLFICALRQFSVFNEANFFVCYIKASTFKFAVQTDENQHSSESVLQVFLYRTAKGKPAGFGISVCRSGGAFRVVQQMHTINSGYFRLVPF